MLARYRKHVFLSVGMMIILSMVICSVVSAEQKKIEITFWHHWSNRTELVQTMLDAFMKEHPNIQVNQIYAVLTDKPEQLISFILGGSPPEVVMYRTIDAPTLIGMGGMKSLTDLMKTDNVDPKIFIPSDISPFQVGGNTYALPALSGAAWTNLMFINRTLLNEAGMNPNAPPRTWADLITASRRLTKSSGDGRITQIGAQLPFPLYAGAWNAAKMWSDDWRKATLNNERSLQALNFAQEMIRVQTGDWATYNALKPSTGWDRGIMAFAFGNSSRFDGLIRDKRVADWSATLAPTSGQSGAEPLGFVVSTWAYGIPASLPPEKLEATWELLKWLTLNEDSAGWFARSQGRPSPVIRFNRNRAYFDVNPYWSVVIDAAMKSTTNPPVDVIPLHDEFELALRGKKQPIQALADAQMIFQDELDKYWQMMDRAK